MKKLVPYSTFMKIAADYGWGSDKIKQMKETHETNPKDEKPLMKWFTEFEQHLTKMGGDYKDIKPTDMLELYYKGISARDAASKLK